MTGEPAPLFAGRGEDWWLSTAAGDRVVPAFTNDTAIAGRPAPTHTVLDDRRSIAEHHGLADEHGIVELDACSRLLAGVPRVFEPRFRAHLVAGYHCVDGTHSDFIRSDERCRTAPFRYDQAVGQLRRPHRTHVGQ